MPPNYHNPSQTSNLVSVILPTFNSERFVIKTLESVLSQSWGNLEVIAVDDASTDLTPNILNDFAVKDSRLAVTILPSNCGAAVTRNTALRIARGRYIAFLDADDLWDPNKLTDQLLFLRTTKSAFTFTPYRLIDIDGNPINKIIDLTSPDVVNYQDMLRKRATLGCSTVLIDQTITGPLQMPLIRTGQDYALWLSILKRGITASRYPEPLTSYRIVPGSISRNKFRKARRQWEIYRDIEKLNLLDSANCFLHYAWRAISR